MDDGALETVRPLRAVQTLDVHRAGAWRLPVRFDGHDVTSADRDVGDRELRPGDSARTPAHQRDGHPRRRTTVLERDRVPSGIEADLQRSAPSARAVHLDLPARPV